MKKPASTFRPFVRARFLAAIAIVVGFVTFFAVPAFMQDSPQKAARNVSSNVERADERVWRSLFADEGRESVANSLIPGTQQNSDRPSGGEVQSYELPKVLPAVFNGDVRDLPVVPQKEREERELEERHAR